MSNKKSSIVSKLKNTPFREISLLQNVNEGNGKKSVKNVFSVTPELEQAHVFSSTKRSPLAHFTTKNQLLSKVETTSTSASSQIKTFDNHFSAEPPKSLKRYKGQVCCICRDPLRLALPGQVILLLLCEHLCHKNCFLTLLDLQDRKRLPICDICKVPTNVADEDVYLDMINAITTVEESNVDSGTTNEEEVDFTMDVSTPVLLQNISEPWVNTPTDQLLNDQLNTPSTSRHGIDYESLLYNPNITCMSDIHPIRLNESHEINCVINIKPPAIYNDSNLQFIPSELKLKWEVSSYISQQLGLNREMGELIIFDKMKISIDGEEWDDSCIYLFSKYLLVYNGEALAGMISVLDDLCLASLTGGVLNLNLAESTLPELYLYNQFSQTITEKWEYVLCKLMDRKQPIINLFQFTSTCWLDLQYGVDVPLNLIRFNNLLLQGGELPSSYIIKILPCPQPLAMNLIVAVPLFNKTKLCNTEYLHLLQKLLHRIRSTLNATDKLAIIFLGVDCLHRPKASGTFVGCVEASWDGWDDLINDMSIVPNIFKNNFQELNIAFQKCADLYPFIPIQGNSINKFLLLNWGDYKDDGQLHSIFNMNKIKRVSLTIIRVGSHLDILEDVEALSKFEYGNDPVLRFETPEKLIASVEPLMSRIQSICLPYLLVEVKTEINATITSMELFGSVEQTNIQSQKICFRGVVPSEERNFLLTIKLYQIPQDFEKVPILKYTARWRGDKSIQRIVYAKLGVIRPPIIPTENDTIFFSEATNAGSFEKDHPSRTYYLDILLLPLLSPSGNASFAKRRAELLIVQYLRQAIAEKDSSTLKAAVSVVYRLLKCISPDFEGEIVPQRAQLDSNAKDVSILDLMAMTRSGNLENQRYVYLLVGQLEQIIPLFDIDPTNAVDRCFDLVYSLV